MKKKTSSPTKNIEKSPTQPLGFFYEDVNTKKTPEKTTENFTIEEKQSPEIDIPQIDKNAELKIESAPNTVEEIPLQEKKNSLYFITGTIISLFIIVTTITLGYFYFFSPNINFLTPKTNEITAQLTTPSPELSPTATPSPILPNSEITITILNGSGKTGEAAKIGKQMELLGYKVESLGNAPDQLGTTIVLDKSLDSQKDILTTELKKTFPSATFSTTTLEIKSKVKITLGK